MCNLQKFLILVWFRSIVFHSIFSYKILDIRVYKYIERMCVLAVAYRFLEVKGHKFTFFISESTSRSLFMWWLIPLTRSLELVALLFMCCQNYMKNLEMHSFRRNCLLSILVCLWHIDAKDVLTMFTNSITSRLVGSRFLEGITVGEVSGLLGLF